ncbi:hypothetical protein JGU66_36000 [Myxococcaceae bacterium JPH2]|nr:hypothetical protein [Myxococcaceae bacterium JPH2]
MTSCNSHLPAQVFEFQSSKVRVVIDERGEPWFVAADLTKVLGFDMTSDLTCLLREHHVRTQGVRTRRGGQMVATISEPGLYRTLLHSKSKRAVAFQDWISEAILPSVRKTGASIVSIESMRLSVEQMFLRPGLARWTKRFPDEFYREIFRLKNWPWNGPQSPRPGIIAYYTNDIVYARLAPGLLALLWARNPINEVTGRREAKHHQYLSDEGGCPALDRHLHSVICIMRSAACWDDFILQMDRIHPRWGDNLMLPMLYEGRSQSL